MSGGGGGGYNPPTPKEPCKDRYELELNDWQLTGPANTIVPSLPDPSPVDLRVNPQDNTIEVYDLSGNKLGHVHKLGLKRCLEEHDYDGMFFRKGTMPWIRMEKA